LTTTPTEPVVEGRPRAAWVAAAPPLALGLLTLVMLAMAVAGEHPMWRVRDLNLAEAAGSRETATVALLIGQGHDPNRTYFVRPGIIDERISGTMTPLRAAVESRRSEMILLLLQQGAVLDETQRVTLACLAKTRGDGDVLAVLEGERGAVKCAAGNASPGEQR
jgi:hypothetical protein